MSFRRRKPPFLFFVASLRREPFESAVVAFATIVSTSITSTTITKDLAERPNAAQLVFKLSDNCNTSIVNFHRSCPNPNCQYDLCLACCMELRNGLQCEEIPASGNQGTDDTQPLTSVWRAEINGGIPCPPKARGGCGTTFLSLKRLLEAKWVDKLVKNVEELTIKYQPPNIDLSLGCSMCQSFEEDAVHNFVRKAASREISYDNYLYCPDAVKMEDKDFEHFQRHWIRGEPVIVRNVFEKGSGLSWNPMVMWRAFRGAKKILKEEAAAFKAIDCLDWCEVHDF
ncbi:hypothetical protein Fmac_032016 [Flemingia macrophylla]|uniref:Uncharacterized protein n=1 Tax=Flemingia macrophylla TaxID=520843 RepID=A0ABD1L522_9FABA